VRIAQVAPLHESVPPKLYGGTERVVSYLTEELVRQGHDVTLFASGDSRTSARLIAPCQAGLRLARTCDRIAPHVLMLEMVLDRQHEFDIIHFHCDHLHFPLVRRMATPSITTTHGRLDLPEYSRLYAEFGDVPLVSISDSQRRPLPFANWRGTVYHGLPPDLLRFSAAPRTGRGRYLAFTGRLSREKQPDVAIRIARAAGIELCIAAKIDPTEQDYFDLVIRPLLGPGVRYLGEIGEEAKAEFLGGALALLFPIDWPEPFGLVMIEAMACGTPVIAFPCGSVPEIITDGATGFLVPGVDQAVHAVHEVVRGRIDRRCCRQVFCERFTDARMARDYLRIYQRLAGDSRAQPGRGAGGDAAYPLRGPSPIDRSLRTGTDHGRHPRV
jgi:glycosyltransferase involved in cell wall biosynthesis